MNVYLTREVPGRRVTYKKKKYWSCKWNILVGFFFPVTQKPKKWLGLDLDPWLSYLKGLGEEERCVSTCFNPLYTGDEMYQGLLMPQINLHMHQGTLWVHGLVSGEICPGLFCELIEVVHQHWVWHWLDDGADGLWLRKHGVYFCPFPWLNMRPQSFNPSASVSSPALCLYLYRR